MREITSCDIFNIECDCIVIPTNGIVKANGDAVMGAGLAKTCDLKYGVSRNLGMCLKHGNHVYNLGYYDGHYICSFPTKHHWRDKSDISLIISSANELISHANINNWNKVILPAVGCGLGGLNYEDVRNTLANILDDRFIIIRKSTPTVRSAYFNNSIY